MLTQATVQIILNHDFTLSNTGEKRKRKITRADKKEIIKVIERDQPDMVPLIEVMLNDSNPKLVTVTLYKIEEMVSDMFEEGLTLEDLHRAGLGRWEIGRHDDRVDSWHDWFLIEKVASDINKELGRESTCASDLLSDSQYLLCLESRSLHKELHWIGIARIGMQGRNILTLVREAPESAERNAFIQWIASHPNHIRAIEVAMDRNMIDIPSIQNILDQEVMTAPSLVQGLI